MSALHTALVKFFATMSIAAGLIAGCGGSATSSNAIVGGGASCAALSRAQQVKDSTTVFDGTTLRGPTVQVGPTQVLLSPARLRVSRYLKGDGPRVVEIQTAVTRRGSGLAEGEDGIQAGPGERWRIYAVGKSQPFLTSICDGSHRLRSRG
jgi:hypothetical protein